MREDFEPLGSVAATPPEEDLAATVPDWPHGRTASSPISRYRILGPLGIGGMGVVYRGEDTLLGRTVALKFLPPMLTPNPRAKSRFLDEARAASALDHPNVCTIYEIGETAEGQLYLAMACYDGETLKHRLEHGSLPIAEALQIAVQVARGLAKAHRHGIVHRDIKPANLMITTDGIVKILDFGIAKLPEQELTGPLLGTPAYMSPEQARGGEIDPRSDVWSLGAVLYEMLTGCRWRTGERDEYKPTPEIGRVLFRMLAAKPMDRYPDADALLVDLSALENAASGFQTPVRSWPQFPWWIGVLLVALTMVSGFWIFGSLRGHGAAARPALLQATMTRLTDLPERAWFPSLSPDGSLFLYARKTDGRSHLFLQRVGGDHAIDLQPSSEDDSQPAFSPDGQQIAFHSERDGGGLFVMGATGESVRRIFDFGFNPAWSPNGKEIAFATEGITNPRIRRLPRSDIFRIDLAGGEPHRISTADAVQPNWSPSGLRIAYWGVSESGQRAIWTLPAGGHEATRVTDGTHLDWNPVWSPDGRYLYFASDRSGVMNLWRIAIEERSGRVLGKPEPVTTSSQASLLPSISQDGRRIAYASDDSKSIIERVDLDPVSGTAKGPAVEIARTSQMIFTFDTSPDGQWLVVQTSVPREDLFVVHPDGSGLRQLTSGGNNRQPRWSPDGKRIAFYSNRGGKYEIWTLRADGSQIERAAAIPDLKAYHPIWSPDGKWIACDVDVNEALIDLTRPPKERRARLLPPPGRGMSFIASSWSADSQWLAGVLQPSGGQQAPGIVLYSPASGRYERLTDRGQSPSWFSDSRRLLYWDDNKVFLLDTRTRASRQIFSAPPNADYRDFSLSPDERTLYLVRNTDEGDIWLLTLK